MEDSGATKETETTKTTTYDVIVIGGGVMGSSTAYQTAKRGSKTLLLEQFDFLHHRGSSHGESRNTHAAYPEDYYTPLVLESNALWRRAEAEIGYKIMEPPWKAYNVLRKMDYPYEHIVHSMKDPSIAAFWLFTLPEVAGGFEYDDDIKKKIWWQYKESMRYDQLRDVVAKRKPGWEHLQEALISIDPDRARNDPVIVQNIPYYNAKKALEAEAMKLNPPPRPTDWGWQELNLPLNESSWSKEDLKDPDKFYEMTVLLNGQREMAEKILDAQWENKWRQEKLNEMLEEKVRPYIQNTDNAVLSRPILLQSQDQNKKVLISSPNLH